MSTSQTSSTPYKSPVSPEWRHAITILLGHPLTSEPGRCIQKLILYQEILNCTDFVILWIPVQFEDSRHLQEYAETDGSIAYLQSNTVKQLISLRNYMILLIKQDKPADQKCNVLYFILDDQWFNLTAHDMRTTLVNTGLEYHSSQTTPGTHMSNFTSPSSSASMRSPIHLELAPFKKSIKPDDPPQDVDKSHLSNSTSTITNLNETCSLDTSCDHLLHLDSPSLSSELRDTSRLKVLKLSLSIWRLPGPFI